MSKSTLSILTLLFGWLGSHKFGSATQVMLAKQYAFVTI